MGKNNVSVEKRKEWINKGACGETKGCVEKEGRWENKKEGTMWRNQDTHTTCAHTHCAGASCQGAVSSS